MRSYACAAVAAISICLGLQSPASGQNAATPPLDPYDGGAIPPPLRGPFISDPAVIALLDCPTPACDGPLSFSRLIQARLPTGEALPSGTNPFNLPVAEILRKTIEGDLDELRPVPVGNGKDNRLDPRFLTFPGSRVELVGIVNRMDRQFIIDSSQRQTPEQQICGEISVIYRFAYSTTPGGLASRLPVTMNLVFPALPSDTRDGAVTCTNIARRWLDETGRTDIRTPAQIAGDLFDPGSGPLAFLTGSDMERLELNMQAYRLPAGIAQDFGTKAAYLIRVFRWAEKEEVFLPAFMTNQIDRARLICSGPNDPDCAEKESLRRRLVAFLQEPATVSALEKGELDIPDRLQVRATRAISISPGGPHRSANQPFWKGPSPQQDVITDAEIEEALRIARKAGVQFSFVKSAEDFRTRLNESTCSGCHQTRAIAGFHFPGADRPGTPLPNAVLLPGSPQFYGDQIRRVGILKLMAERPDARLTEYELATGYAARPLNKFATELGGTELIGGWGGTCLTDDVKSKSQRQWTCRSGLVCRQLFRSANSPGVGTCVPGNAAGPQIGDALQTGVVLSFAFGADEYKRLTPKSPNMLIPPGALPSSPPKGNSYYGSHQEFFPGKTEPPPLSHADRRDRLTGGFPAGMLRLSECLGLPEEATCGLVASTGFNDCIAAVGPEIDLDTCFSTFTSFAGVRACNAWRPCRDDYICVQSIGYSPDNAKQLYDARQQRLRTSGNFKKITGRNYDETDFGQKRPDDTWVGHNDRRGLCIPPYFVFQFRADGHPSPPEH